jgi:hypothetical protein
MPKKEQILSVPILLYGSECGARKNQQEGRISAADTRFLRAVACYRGTDHIRNRYTTTKYF